MRTYEPVEPGSGKVNFYTVLALLVILACNLVYPNDVSTVPVKASSAPTGCNELNASNSASTSRAANLMPGHIRYVVEFNCGRWNDVAVPSLASMDGAPEVTTRWMDQGAGYILVTGVRDAQIVPSLVNGTVERINPEFGYKHDESGTQIVPPTTQIAVKPFSLEYGFKHDARGTQIVPRPTRIKVESLNLEYGFKHDASGTRIVPSLTSMTIAIGK